MNARSRKAFDDEAPALAWGLATSAFGPCYLVWEEGVEVALHELGLGTPADADVGFRYYVRDDVRAGTLAREVFAYPCDGHVPAAHPPLRLQGSAFRLRVWEALRATRPGETVSYGELALRLGLPSAVRAVAGAVAANRIAWCIPCHRVLRGDGNLGGFRWGTAQKRALLEAEAQLPAVLAV